MLLPRRLGWLATSLFVAVIGLSGLCGFSDAMAGPPDSYKTRTLRLKHMTAERAVALHERVVGSQGESSIVARPDGRSVIVHDTAPRLRRFRTLLRELDVADDGGERRLYVRPVLHVTPSRLAELALDVFDQQKGADALKIIADDRAGVLVVSTTYPTYLKLDRLLRRLDSSPYRGRRAIRVTPAPPGDVFR